MRNERALAVERAREKVGTFPGYTVLARPDDSDSMNCESFVRWSFEGRAASGQAHMWKRGLDATLRVVRLILFQCLLFGALDTAWYCWIATAVGEFGISYVLKRCGINFLMMLAPLAGICFHVNDVYRGRACIGLFMVHLLYHYLNTVLERFWGIRSS